MTQDATEMKPTSSEEGAIVPVSNETRALVESKMPDESDEVKQKFAELVEAIKQRAATEVSSAEEMSREAYITALEKAQLTMNKAQSFFQDQEKTIEGNIHQVKDEATKKWDTLMADIKSMGNRVDRAVEAAWTILTEDEPKA
jgi:vacuolar-type H+-ATPase subunit H